MNDMPIPYIPESREVIEHRWADGDYDSQGKSGLQEAKDTMSMLAWTVLLSTCFFFVIGVIIYTLTT